MRNTLSFRPLFLQELEDAGLKVLAGREGVLGGWTVGSAREGSPGVVQVEDCLSFERRAVPLVVIY